METKTKENKWLDKFISEQENNRNIEKKLCYKANKGKSKKVALEIVRAGDVRDNYNFIEFGIY